MGMAMTLFGISFTSPSETLFPLALAILALSLFKGCLHIAGLAYELESIEEKCYSVGSAYLITGYRIGLLSAGAGALYLSLLIDWAWMFRTMALLLVAGIVVIWMQPEPYKSKSTLEKRSQQFSKYNSWFQGFWKETIWHPCRQFILKPQFGMILIILFVFRLGEHMAKSMEGPFYIELGFTKADVAAVSKLWGMLTTISGAFICGLGIKNKNPFEAVAKIGFIHACSLLCYYFLSLSGKSFPALYITVALEHFTGGMAMTAFIYFLWKVCDREYAAIQYTLLWSVFSFKSDIFAALGGFLAFYCSWNTFFLLVSLLGIGSSLLVIYGIMSTQWTLPGVSLKILKK